MLNRSTAAITTVALPITMNRSEAQQLLMKLNDEKALSYLPVIIYMLILLTVGTFGNILVCLVYYNKSTKTSSHYFILALAAFDLLTCLVGMPTEIADLRFPYMFYASAACKLLRFVESVSIIGSSIILIAVAVDRFYRICRLGKQVMVKTAKIICLVAFCVGILCSWPCCILFGEKTIELDIPGVEGVDCSTDDSIKGTIYPTLYYGFLFLLFIGCLILFTVIYSKIGAVICSRKKAKIGEQIPETPTNNKDKSFNDSMASDRVSSDPITTEMSSDQENWNDDRRMSSGSNYQSTFTNKRHSRNQIRVTRTTVVLFAVTVAYVISFLPFLIVMVVRNIIHDFEENLDDASEVVYKFCVKSYFINNAINPVIYSFLNENFRKDTKVIFRKCMMACCCCRNRNV